jgi:hypothetical protein
MQLIAKNGGTWRLSTSTDERAAASFYPLHLAISLRPALS